MFASITKHLKRGMSAVKSVLAVAGTTPRRRVGAILRLPQRTDRPTANRVTRTLPSCV